jgi:hypothetical protein
VRDELVLGRDLGPSAHFGVSGRASSGGKIPEGLLTRRLLEKSKNIIGNFALGPSRAKLG